LPAGVYTIVASAPTLSLSGAAVVVGPTVQARAERTSILAGRIGSVAIELDRIDRSSGNLAALHAGGTGFLDANCVACHGDRKGEVSGDPARKPFHAMATHASKGCSFCHAKVDILGGSGAALRKQVSASRCKGCHPGYPASF
jgi:hypothetical protein